MSVPSRTYLPAIAIFFVLLITASVVSVAYLIQRHYIASMFDQLADARCETLKDLVESDIHFIGSGAYFFQSTDKENWSNFEEFADNVVQGSESLIALQWMPKLKKKDVAGYVSKMRQQQANFDIFTMPKNQEKQWGYRQGNEQPIYVISDIFPRTSTNLALIGFYSLRTRFSVVVDNISRTGKPNLSDKVRLLQDGSGPSVPKDGMLVYYPVFAKDDKTLIGVVAGVVRMSEYFDELVAKSFAEHDLSVKITDLGYDTEDDPVLYQSPDWGTLKGLEVSKRVLLPNREWIVDFKLSNPLSRSDKWILYGLSAGGAVLSILTGFLVYLLSREKEKLTRELSERDKEVGHLAEHDSLTDIYNRQAFGRLLRPFIENDKPCSLIAFDIDYFRSVNEEYSQAGGDEVLIHVSRTIESVLDNRDIFLRMEGDEFAIISHIAEEKHLRRFIEMLQRSVELTCCQYLHYEICCTISVGAVINRGFSEEQLLKKSEAKLYESKANGRNRLSIDA